MRPVTGEARRSSAEREAQQNSPAESHEEMVVSPTNAGVRTRRSRRDQSATATRSLTTLLPYVSTKGGSPIPTRSGNIPALNVMLGWWWRPVCGRDSGWRRLTLFPHVARGLTCQRCVAAAFPRPSSVT